MHQKHKLWPTQLKSRWSFIFRWKSRLCESTKYSPKWTPFKSTTSEAGAAKEFWEAVISVWLVNCTVNRRATKESKSFCRLKRQYSWRACDVINNKTFYRLVSIVAVPFTVRFQNLIFNVKLLKCFTIFQELTGNNFLLNPKQMSVLGSIRICLNCSRRSYSCVGLRSVPLISWRPISRFITSGIALSWSRD